MQLINECGHEVASHGYAHNPIASLGALAFREDLQRSVRILEDITGKKVSGHRAPDWSITDGCSWAFEVLAEEGFEYDSSVFPTRLHPYGMPSSSPHPHLLSLPSGRSIYDFPAQVFRIGPIRVPTAGGFYLRALPLWISEWALRQSEKRGYSGMVYLHPYDLDPETPVLGTRVTFRFIRYYHLDKTELFLIRLLRGFEFCPVVEILNSIKKGKEKATAR